MTPEDPMPDSPLREALTEWDAIEGSSLADQFRAFIAAGKMADAIRATLATTPPLEPSPSLDAERLAVLDAAKPVDYLAAKDRSADEHRDPSDCPSCGEWRDSPAADCAACGLSAKP
jgi:hypothetical protein